jgi:hypothetical protein
MSQDSDQRKEVTVAQLARPAAAVTLSKQAEDYLKGLGFPTRTILSRALRDQLLEPSELDAQRISTLPGDRFVLPVGNFRVVFRMLEPGQLGGGTRFVELIEHKGKQADAGQDVNQVQSTPIA